MSELIKYVFDNYEMSNYPQYGSCFLIQDRYFIFPDKKGEKFYLRSPQNIIYTQLKIFLWN